MESEIAAASVRALYILPGGELQPYTDGMNTLLRPDSPEFSYKTALCRKRNMVTTGYDPVVADQSDKSDLLMALFSMFKSYEQLFNSSYLSFFLDAIGVTYH